MVVFFRAVPASAATAAPARLLPVSATPRTRSSVTTTAAMRSFAAKMLLYAPGGAPASRKSCSTASAHCGTPEACLTTTVLPAIRLGAATRASW